MNRKNVENVEKKCLKNYITRKTNACVEQK